MSKDIENKIDKKIPCIDDGTYDFVDLVTLFTYHFIDISDDNHKKLDKLNLSQFVITQYLAFL